MFWEPTCQLADEGYDPSTFDIILSFTQKTLLMIRVNFETRSFNESILHGVWDHASATTRLLYHPWMHNHRIEIY